MTKGKSRTEYLTDLEKWQAHNPTELGQIRPEDLFEAVFVERYKGLHEGLYGRLIRAHETLLMVEELSRFPFDHLYAPSMMEFWRLVVENFADTALLLLHGLAIDQGRDVHSLMSFKNAIVHATWLRPDMRELFMETLNKRKFDKAAKSIANRVEEIRNSHIAHRLKDKQSGLPKDGLAAVSLEEIWVLFDQIHSLFGGLSFGSTYATLAGDMTPSTVGGELTPTCLDSVLNAVLRDSYCVNEPERKAEWWPALRKHRNPEELRVLNDMRNRIGLPEA